MPYPILSHRFIYDPDEAGSEDERAQLRRDKVSQLRAMFEAGSPWFTKAFMREFADELERLRAMPLEEVKGQIFSVTGVDGERFNEPIHFTGEVVKANMVEKMEKFNSRDNSEANDAPADTAKTWEYVYTWPRASYRTVDAMISQPEDSNRPPRYLPLPMTLCCSARKRDRTTHEFVVDPPAFSRDVVQAFWEATCAGWRASENYAVLKQQLEAAVSSMAAAGTLPTKVIGLGLGSFSIYGYLYEGSVLQHALVLLIRDVLAAGAGAEASTTTVPCYVQDPGYQPEDESILTEAGFTLLQDPRGFIEIDDGSVVVTQGPDVPVKAIVADLARPVILIWAHPPGQEQDKTPLWLVTDPMTPRVKSMLSSDYFPKIDLPDYGEGVFRWLSMHVRKSLAEK
ncbi:hypothetical protein B0T26DRAFT_724371 [Lasiosphaeria miniovina]|uniref:SRR1-like domain-containing protein n=1 Tax=Lasiosphaeria miniovina TaxID=1954250 RepID=A0AA40A6P6_9PEZI|nr:uncharacterized protein B0T26DRAFT_724371 [Lasiosphaeria miniovina]KAK0710230.1 hypothetical protein B0T26DRAFT_724371 [Lasiosphaeria miniovina]